MGLTINTNYSANYCQKYNHISFNGLSQKAMRNTGYTLLAATMFTLASCSNKQPQTDTVEITKTETKDTVNTAVDSTKKKSDVIYHYFPKDDNIITEEPDWLEKIYPDGSREIDSLGYKIMVSPEGKRTITKTEIDQWGNIITSTDFPDSTKTVKTTYKTLNHNEVLQIEKTYRSNGKLEESRWLNEYPSDSTDISSPKITEQGYERFNEDEVLLYWESSRKNIEKNDSSIIYDDDNRIVFNERENEKYYYKGSHKTPYTSISEYKDCKRITLYNDSGYVEKVYFEAADGTITQP